MSKPRHARRKRSYAAVTTAAAVGTAGAALPFAMAYAASPSAPPPAPARDAAATFPAHRAFPEARAAAPERYAVRPGDTLSAIARRFCGSAADYPALAAASAIENASLIYPGETIRLACHAAARAVARALADPKRVPVSRPVSDPVTTGVTATVTAVGGTLSCAGLEALWDAAGGNPGDAFMAAEIAEAESGGRQYALSPTDDRGYWQISYTHGSLSTYDALGNARAAVEISSDGTDWSPWTTYEENLYEGRC